MAKRKAKRMKAWTGVQHVFPDGRHIGPIHPYADVHFRRQARQYGFRIARVRVVEVVTPRRRTA